MSNNRSQAISTLHFLNQKKIGIWGFGVVGKSALNFIDQFDLTSITILNNHQIEALTTKNSSNFLLQDQITIHQLLQDNDYILVSPGIPLHDYQAYKHKFISELDLFYDANKLPTIAITGSLGKTSITHLMTNILQKSNIAAVAAGNIGYAMLNLVTPSINKNIDAIQTIILELSSFQLQQAQDFAPDFAIITNIYDNHLDHHASIEEYCDAKFHIFQHQSENQIALIAYDLLSIINKKYKIKKNWAFFCPTILTQPIDNTALNAAIYYLDDKKIYKKQNESIEFIFDISQLLPITFDTNWLIIIATLHLKQIPLTSLTEIINKLDIPDHRLQKVRSFHGSVFYNDSKSTVWQATLQAVNCMDDKPIKLFLGGLSKGADRTPLLQALQQKKIEIYAFGKEAFIIAQLCKQFNIPHYAHANLEESFDACMQNIIKPSNILFSPAGSSYDLFENYIQRGQRFTQLVHNYKKIY